MLRFKLDIAGEVQLDRAIGRFSDGVSDYRPIWPVIEDEFYAEMKGQFASEGEQGGEKWPALSPEYAGWKEIHFPGQPILQRTGDLYNSLTSPNDPNAVRDEKAKALTLGTKLPYAIYHQSPKPRRVLPRRAPINLTEQFKRQTMRLLHTYLVEKATAAGFRGGLTPTASSKLASIFGMGIPPRGVSPRRSRLDGTRLF